MADQEEQPFARETDDMDWVDSGNPTEEELAPLRPPTPLPNHNTNLNRRCSISLPAGLNVNNPQIKVTRDSDDDSSDTYGISDEEQEERIAVRVPLHNSRKKSLGPPLIKINDSDYLDIPEPSPANSTSSLNSLSNLLKEKLVMNFPGVLLKKKPREYKLKGFVALLFLTNVFLVGFAYVFYHQQVLQRAYFEKIRFNNKDRIVRVFHDDGQEILYGYLGTFLNRDKVFQCLPQDILDDGSVCMEWMHKARLYLRYKVLNDVRCYNILWFSLADHVYPTDCFDLSDGKGHWYGGGQIVNMTWPLEKGRVALAPFITGYIHNHSWGNVLNRFFLNMKGVALSVDKKTPLYVSVNAGDTKRLCLQGRYDDFPYAYHEEPYPQLNYSICASSSISSLHRFLINKTLHQNESGSRINTVVTLLTEPVLHLASRDKSQLTESMVLNSTDDVIPLKSLGKGHVILNEFWQPTIGDFVVDTERFPTMKETIDILFRRGFKTVFTIQPFISTESNNFPMAVDNKLLVTERDSDIPALTKYRTLMSAGILDITNNNTVLWLKEKLKALENEYGVNNIAFYLDLGTAYDLPPYYMLRNKFTGPDQYKTLFEQSISGNVDIIGVSSATRKPPLPIFVSLPRLWSSWKSLKIIIPTILTYSIAGYPFIMPGPIGGEIIVSKTSSLPDRELYIRWLQLATFLPVIQYMHLPSSYDDEVLDMADYYADLRLRVVNPLLIKYMKIAMEQGLPIIRPLWMIDPNDIHCQTVSDEFAIGEELIVAPIVTRSSTERKVYLPQGMWRDGIYGNKRKGKRWIYDYEIPKDKIAYFTKIIDVDSIY